MIYDFIRHWVLLLGGMQTLAFWGAGCSRIISYMHASDWHCGLFFGSDNYGLGVEQAGSVRFGDT